MSRVSLSRQDISPTIRLTITRVGLIINLLSQYCIPISADIITQAYEVSIRIVGEEAEGVRRLAQVEVGEELLRALALGQAEAM